MINVKSAVIHVKLRSCYTSRKERTLLDRKTCPFWSACGVVDWDGGSIENLVRRIIRSVQEPSADSRWPTTVMAKANHSRRKQITHGKEKRSRQKQIRSRQKKIAHGKSKFTHGKRKSTQCDIFIAEVSLFCFDRSVVTLHRRASDGLTSCFSLTLASRVSANVVYF